MLWNPCVTVSTFLQQICLLFTTYKASYCNLNIQTGPTCYINTIYEVYVNHIITDCRLWGIQDFARNWAIRWQRISVSTQHHKIRRSQIPWFLYLQVQPLGEEASDTASTTSLCRVCWNSRVADAVNLGARFEGQTRNYDGVDLLLSEGTYR